VYGIDSTIGIKLESLSRRKEPTAPGNSRELQPRRSRPFKSVIGVPAVGLFWSVLLQSAPTRTGLAAWLNNRAVWIPEITLPKVYIAQDIVTSALPSGDKHPPGAFIVSVSAVNI